MAALNPYLNFDGNTEEAFNFYKSVFGGEFLGGIMRFGDGPGCENMPESAKAKVMHVALPIGKNSVLMGTDWVEGMGPNLIVGNNLSITIFPESREDADRLFNGLSAGGKVGVPLQDMFWGAYWGAFEDKFGINWMVNYDPKAQQ